MAPPNLRTSHLVAEMEVDGSHSPASHTDNRFDYRQFLYAAWTEQFNRIDRMVSVIEKECFKNSTYFWK